MGRNNLLITIAILCVLLTSCGDRPTPLATMVSEASAQGPVESPSAKDTLTLAMVGDIMLGTTYPESPKGAYLPANDAADVLRDALPLLRDADLALGNLEGSLLDRGGKVKPCGNPATCYAFRMPRRYVRHLVDAGFDYVGIANNHINDFGPEGIASTMAVLDSAGIKYSGMAGKCNTAVIIRDGRKIGLVAFGFSRGTLNINNIPEAQRIVRDLKKDNDIVIVSFHGGAEGKKYTHVPRKVEVAFGQQRGDVEKFAHAVVDAGADVVYGHSPHVVRGAELYKDRLILYSLGNFATPYRFSITGISGYAPVVTATINADGSFASGKIHSFIQQKGVGPRVDPTNAVAKEIRSLSLADFPASPLTIASDGTMTKK